MLKARADSASYRGKIPMTRLKIQGKYYYNIDYSHRSYDGLDSLYDCDGKIHCSFGGKIINPTYECENFMQSATEKISFY